MQRYLLQTHLLHLTNPSQFRSNIQTSTVHNFWPILQVFDGAQSVCQDPNTALIRVESMIESIPDGNEFRSKDGTVVRIPDFR
ncbi:hypothetical protein TNCV_3077521 [Trichonephila clavipes]|nr:hypothetical protein TNCV_3077521 [Trichonephila clavipes]